MKLALVNLVPLKEGSMQARDLVSQYEGNTKKIMIALASDLGQIYMDMEQNAEPEGGPVADQFADDIHTHEEAAKLLGYRLIPTGNYDDPNNGIEIRKIDSSRGSGPDGEMTYDDMIKKHYGKSPKGAGPGGPIFESEKSWNAVDVSRTAEKGLSNREWNERTAKKLDMLIALNKASKFKKDFSDEEGMKRLRGWVDQNYSWEKLARQFKNINEMKVKKQKNILTERFQELAGIKPLYIGETMQQGDYTAIEQGWDGLPWDEQKDIINTALSGEARPDEYEKDFDQLKSEIPDWESIVANYLGIDEGEDFRLEPEDLDNPDEDLVIIGSGYLDIKNNFKERPPQTNGEYATLGQKVVDQLHNGDKDAALDYIYSKINEGSCGYSQEAPGGKELKTPGSTKGMPADKRTMGMMREVIKNEIKKMHENK